MNVADIMKQAMTCKESVEKLQKIGVSTINSYYFAKTILGAKEIKEIKIKTAPEPVEDHISRQIKKADYVDMAKRLVAYVEEHKVLPNYLTYKSLKIRPMLYTYLFAYAVVVSIQTGYLPSEVNVSSKLFVKKTETTNTVYDYFVKTFGSFGDTIDGALTKIAGRQYGYYYDDKYSNKESINRMKNRQGVNCTDSCQVFYNIMLELIKKGKYRKVECLHIKCRGGDGHVRLRITLKDGSYIYRDPAAVLSNGNVTSNWCMNGTLLAVNPSWFMANLNR